MREAFVSSPYFALHLRESTASLSVNSYITCSSTKEDFLLPESIIAAARGTDVFRTLQNF